MSDQTTNDETIRAAIVAERTDLAAMLAALRPEQWDAPTLCAGWRVREVVAHMTMAYRMSVPGGASVRSPSRTLLPAR